MDIDHLKQKFLNETESLLTSLDNILIELEKAKNNSALIIEVFRVMHTIKGASGMFGYDKVVEITHELESIYDLVRENVLEVSPEIIELSFRAADHIRLLLSDEHFKNHENIKNHSMLIRNLNALKNNNNSLIKKQNPELPGTVKNSGIITWHIIFYPNDKIIDRAINLVHTFNDLFILGEYRIHYQSLPKSEPFWNIFLATEKGFDKIEEALMFIMDYCKVNQIANFNIFNASEFEELKLLLPGERSLIEEVMKLKSNSDIQTQIQLNTKENEVLKIHLQQTTHINVEAEKLDSLMYLVSELVTTKSELLSALAMEYRDKALSAGEKIDKLSKLFSENALALRLVSIHEITEKFKRLIRDLGKQLNKKIEFVTVGTDTKLDKNIIDLLNEPVMHLIRNCIDHGIETPDLRQQLGKSDTGIVKFEAVKTGNHILISISDDGNGIDTTNVYKKAVEKGFISSGTILSEKEILELIFLPGFSTAQNLSNISGRGVGMDIVLKRIQEIRGEISISSIKGKGTTFTIKLQQSISIINTLLVEALNVRYAIPIEDIDACILEAHKNLVDCQNNLFNFNGSLIPFLHIEKPATEIKKNLPEDSDKLVIIKKHDKQFAIVVEQIIGEYQAVIKPLGNIFSKIKFLSGASLLGDGGIALLLDTEKLIYESIEN